MITLVKLKNFVWEKTMAPSFEPLTRLGDLKDVVFETNNSFKFVLKEKGGVEMEVYLKNISSKQIHSCLIETDKARAPESHLKKREGCGR